MLPQANVHKSTMCRSRDFTHTISSMKAYNQTDVKIFRLWFPLIILASVLSKSRNLGLTSRRKLLKLALSAHENYHKIHRNRS